MNATDDPPEDWQDLLRRAIKARCQPPANKRSNYCVLGSVVGELLCVGSTRAWRICQTLGFDPNQRVKA